jgi:mannan endo-1,4-beta-mannosidase
MKTKSNLLYVVCILLTFAGSGAISADGFSVSGSRLIDSNGNPFLPRGTTMGFAWYQAETALYRNDIMSLGANSLRYVCSTGARWKETDLGLIRAIIGMCELSKFVGILEIHDTTGYGEDTDAISLSEAVDYWESVKPGLEGKEAFVIICIGNSPYGSINAENWVSDMGNAISRMRSAGFRHTLMIDAPNWGQDTQHIMRDNAASMLEADPEKNLIFSVNIYDTYGSPAVIRDYLDYYSENNLPLIVGEFGPEYEGTDIDEDTVFSMCRQHDIGYLGWLWCGNDPEYAYLDQVADWDVERLTPWGQRLFNGPDGIRETSVECTAFIGVTPTPYRETWPPDETPSATNTAPVTKGDVDGSGSINIIDALLTAQYYVGLNPANFDPDAGDVDCSGQLDIVDALLIAQRYVGLIESFPC